MGDREEYQPIANSSLDPGYSAYWIGKYCSKTAIEEFTLYFPYVLIIIPLIMVALESGFNKYDFSIIYGLWQRNLMITKVNNLIVNTNYINILFKDFWI